MMGFFYILPILIYYFIVRYFINKYFREDENKLYQNIKGFFEKRKFEKENERNITFKKKKRKLFVKKALLMIVFVSMPFWDSLFYFICIKYISLTNPGIIVYKKVTDIQEQRDYWLWRNLTDERNALSEEYLGNSMGAERSKKISFLRNEDIINNTILKDTALTVYFFVINENDYIKKYYNNCSNKYNTLDKDDKQYKYSCLYSDEIIKKYKLKNVIDNPHSPYVREEKKEYIFEFLNFYKTIEYVKNFDTNEIYGEKIKYSIRRGWYKSLWINSFFGHDIPFEQYGYIPPNFDNDIEKIHLIKTIIPNPYRKEK